ncbi:bifunctional hydroxymethylpyrimidine kinase/phosphomethylpyrimidine kinase [Weissella kandleri]|nr:bifunctional hydroxymethylpyrimidine kinase/phosphomethylpyrimidine kinase [Weissella kandleri]
MMQNKNQPAVVLTIAGADSLSGGGLQADLATFNELKLYGLATVTSIAAVQPDNLKITPLPATLVQDQLQSQQAAFQLRGVKIGLLPTVEQVELVATWIKQLPEKIPVVVDPVLVFKEAQTDAAVGLRDAYLRELFPLATIITPNLTEAMQLTGQALVNEQTVARAGQALLQTGTQSVVIKGGHRLAGPMAKDYLLTQDGNQWLTSPKLTSNNNNGAGCTFSAAILSYLVQGNSLETAVAQAKTFVQHAIEAGLTINEQQGNVWQGANREYSS